MARGRPHLGCRSRASRDPSRRTPPPPGNGRHRPDRSRSTGCAGTSNSRSSDASRSASMRSRTLGSASVGVMLAPSSCPGRSAACNGALLNRTYEMGPGSAMQHSLAACASRPGREAVIAAKSRPACRARSRGRSSCRCVPPIDLPMRPRPADHLVGHRARDLARDRWPVDSRFAALAVGAEDAAEPCRRCRRRMPAAACAGRRRRRLGFRRRASAASRRRISVSIVGVVFALDRALRDDRRALLRRDRPDPRRGRADHACARPSTACPCLPGTRPAPRPCRAP